MSKIPYWGLLGLAFMMSCADLPVDKAVVPPVPTPANGCGPALIQGYCDQMSYAPGDMVTLFLQGQRELICRLNITTDWCGANGMGVQSGEAIKKITRNAIRLLLQDESVFSP